jgi:hypothetical protein
VFVGLFTSNLYGMKNRSVFVNINSLCHFVEGGKFVGFGRHLVYVAFTTKIIMEWLLIYVCLPRVPSEIMSYMLASLCMQTFGEFYLKVSGWPRRSWTWGVVVIMEGVMAMYGGGGPGVSSHVP